MKVDKEVIITSDEGARRYMKEMHPTSKVMPWYVENDSIGMKIKIIKETADFYFTDKNWFIVKEDAEIVG